MTARGCSPCRRMCSLCQADVFSLVGNVFSFLPNMFSFRPNVFTFPSNVFTWRPGVQFSAARVPLGFRRPSGRGDSSLHSEEDGRFTKRPYARWGRGRRDDGGGVGFGRMSWRAGYGRVFLTPYFR